MNTKITYQYRDAENYKEWNYVIIKGELLMNDLIPFLFDKQLFIPSEVGFDDLQKLPFKSYDHIWHEILNVSQTNEKSTLAVEAKDMVSLFQAASERDWNQANVSISKCNIV